jgi:DNA modification methylase
MEINKIYQGDSLTVLKTFPDESVDMVITSPAYYNARDYKMDNQMGRENSPKEYIDNLIIVFKEIYRVLKKEGTCWVNIGDMYGRKCDKNDFKDPKNPDSRNGQVKSLTKNISQKSLLQLPYRFSIAMIDDVGFILRNSLIWHKGNAMPSPVKDRFTVDYEPLFFFTKSKKYYFETQYEPLSENTITDINRRKKFNNKGKIDEYAVTAIGRDRREFVNLEKGRIKRSVWQINTKPTPFSHYAVFPEALCETPIKAGCPEGGIILDPFMGAGTTGVVAKNLNRNYVGIELNPEYIKIAEERIKNS